MKPRSVMGAPPPVDPIAQEMELRDRLAALFGNAPSPMQAEQVPSLVPQMHAAMAPPTNPRQIQLEREIVGMDALRDKIAAQRAAINARPLSPQQPLEGFPSESDNNPFGYARGFEKPQSEPQLPGLALGDAVRGSDRVNDPTMLGERLRRMGPMVETQPGPRTPTTISLDPNRPDKPPTHEMTPDEQMQHDDYVGAHKDKVNLRKERVANRGIARGLGMHPMAYGLVEDSRNNNGGQLGALGSMMIDPSGRLAAITARDNEMGMRGQLAQDQFAHERELAGMSAANERDKMQFQRGMANDEFNAKRSLFEQEMAGKEKQSAYETRASLLGLGLQNPESMPYLEQALKSLNPDDSASTQPSPFADIIPTDKMQSDSAIRKASAASGLDLDRGALLAQLYSQPSKWRGLLTIDSNETFVEEAAQQLKIDQAVVYRWLQEFIANGGKAQDTFDWGSAHQNRMSQAFPQPAGPTA